MILIKNVIKNAVNAVISLCIVSLENPENQNSEIGASTNEAATWMKLFISICILTLRTALFFLIVEKKQAIWLYWFAAQQQTNLVARQKFG